MTDRFPVSVREKLRRLEQQHVDAQALARVNRGVIENLQIMRENARRRLRSSPGEKDAIAALADVEKQLSDAQDELSRRQTRERDAAQTFVRVRNWLDGLPPNRTLEPITVAKPDPENVAAAILEIRDEILAVESEIDDLERMPLAVEDLRSQVRRQVAAWAEHGKPYVNVATGQVSFARPADGNSRLPHELMAWLFPEAMIAKLEALLPFADAVPVADRAKMIKAAKTKLADLELREEAAIGVALAVGVECTRRPTASPAAILQVKVVKQARVAAA